MLFWHKKLVIDIWQITWSKYHFDLGHVTLFLHMSEHSTLKVLQTSDFLYLLILFAIAYQHSHMLSGNIYDCVLFKLVIQCVACYCISYNHVLPTCDLGDCELGDLLGMVDLPVYGTVHQLLFVCAITDLWPSPRHEFSFPLLWLHEWS